MKNNWMRKVIGGLSFTSAMFIFQACYGTPQDFEPDLLLEGQVKAAATGEPIEGIKVLEKSTQQYQQTDKEGRFSFYVMTREELNVFFEDVDAEQNGYYSNLDTVVQTKSSRIYLDIQLEKR